ncbi:hypothetical protein GGTG_01044 [Gaeumannomyces tritici R3-111a-1]|uniref:Anaphase spindle elongation protein 1 n=1 Tax=Gaeumannomyces tritici (strain R3-111a-1) TaxID=644352 RepID=J3NIG3_GAET3|nr:hypothetical protein GGTG_01044 [Gaeumannomyces tritici R3-111a-1]EJT81056.1 hypothetical protein GGTG_01044 [Gaeumannomyces tritici R3-111a-1]
MEDDTSSRRRGGNMDASYLSQQVNTIIGDLHELFDHIGVPSHERKDRETELFAALSETLQKQVHSVSAEKEAMIEEAENIISAIRKMEGSLDDAKPRGDEDDGLKITYPLTRCLQVLKEKHQHVSKLHRDRFEQVKKLVQALESYSLHLEPSFVKLSLPPTGPNQSLPLDFSLSPSYVNKLDDEFTRVYEEYTRRVAAVKATCENIIQLWAELGTPQAQTDGAIVKYYRDAPEQLGLHEEDIAQLRAKLDRLTDEKKNREKRLRDLKAAVEALWEKLGIEEHERKKFLNANRGCGVRQINEFEDELGRLSELKRQNLHLFVEDARFKLQELWDALFLSEDEMLEFTPAFSDVYSDALLEAHEREISRLEVLHEQRAPVLAMVDRHRTLVTERDDLAASSQDASRLMMRGQKGEKRDPGKLLREEKMRKRIAKELPKVTADLCKALESWEDEWGRDFLVHGERYLDVIDASEPRAAGAAAPAPRSKTPGALAPAAALTARPTTAAGRAAPPARAHSSATKSTTVPVQAPARSHSAAAKTPTGTLRRAPPQLQQMQAPSTTTTTASGGSLRGSPSRIPARVPLSNLKHGNNSPERPRPESRGDGDAFRNPPPLMRAPPPKMRDLVAVPEAGLEPPAEIRGRDNQLQASVILRPVDPDDVYDDGRQPAMHMYENPYARPGSRQEMMHASRNVNQYAQSGYARHISNTSTAVSGSENWETYDDNSEPEVDESDAYCSRLRAARSKQHTTPEAGSYHRSQASQSKRPRGVPPTAVTHTGLAMIDANGNRIVSGSDWTDEDAF